MFTEVRLARETDKWVQVMEMEAKGEKRVESLVYSCVV